MFICVDIHYMSDILIRFVFVKSKLVIIKLSKGEGHGSHTFSHGLL